LDFSKMRRTLLLVAACVAAATAGPAGSALAQTRNEREQEQARDEAAKKKSGDEWGDSRASLPQLRNAGPCPFVKVLYDAARYAEFKDGRESASTVGYTGEIQGVSAGCEYKGSDPIKVKVELLFELGKGPAATGESKTYNYWVAVTKRNEAVIAKQDFALPVQFKPGQDRVYVTETLGEIVIPRASMTTSGANFEVLVGFDVTPQMADFNRDGKRFRVNAGAPVDVAGSAATPK
jgi:hypothetical protein